MFKINNEHTRNKSLTENYLTFYSFGICFNVSIGARQDLTRSNAGDSVIFLI